MKRSQASLFVLAGLFATCSFAQQPAGMVNVDLGTVADKVAKNINVEVAMIPASLQVPVAVAATTCDVPAVKLAPAAGTDMASCQAVSTSSALEELVTTKLKAAPKQ